MAKSRTRAVVLDGNIKGGFDLWNGDNGWIYSGPPTDDNMRRSPTVEDYYSRVPWFFAAVEDRQKTLSGVPFAIVKGDTDIDSSGTWANELKMFPDPKALLQKIEASLVMTNRCYLFIETNNFGYGQIVKYLLPQSISEIFDDNGDLEYYERRLQRGQKVRVDPKNIIAIYRPDHTVEYGPGNNSPAKAALMAAGVLFNADQFVARYFEKGAIRATILSVDTADQKEANRLQAWWEDTIAGKLNAWAATVIRGKTATPTIIGDGLEGLQNTDLTQSKRQDIATAIGVPESRMWSAAANYATAEVDDKKYTRDTIVPECWLIEGALNAQLFNAEHNLDGYRWEFRPETGEGFGKDQLDQQSAYSGYVASNMPPSLAAQLVGIELPGEMEYDELDELAEKMKPKPPTIVQPAQQPDNQQPAQPAAEDMPPDKMPAEAVPAKSMIRSALFTWQKAALEAVKTGRNPNVDFDNPSIDSKTAAFLRYELDGCKSAEEVRALFTQAREMSQPPDSNYVLAKEIRLSREMLERIP